MSARSCNSLPAARGQSHAAVRRNFGSCSGRPAARDQRRAGVPRDPGCTAPDAAGASMDRTIRSALRTVGRS